MKPTLSLFFILLSLTIGLEAKTALPAVNQSDSGAQSEVQTPTAILGAQIREIAASTTLSRKSQAKLIANALRQAITTVTHGITDPAERLKLTLELTTAAAKAAPHFAATITNTVASLPVFANDEGALDQIKSAVKAGIESNEEIEIANPAANPPHREFDGPNQPQHIVSGSS